MATLACSVSISALDLHSGAQQVREYPVLQKTQETVWFNLF